MHYFLLQLCCLREFQCPPRLDESFTLPHCSKHWLWRRRNAKKKYHQKRHRVANELSPMVDYNFIVKEGFMQ